MRGDTPVVNSSLNNSFLTLCHCSSDLVKGREDLLFLYKTPIMDGLGNGRESTDKPTPVWGHPTWLAIKGSHVPHLDRGKTR